MSTPGLAIRPFEVHVPDEHLAGLRRRIAVLGAAIATGRKRLWSTVGAWNTPSLRVLEKLGFERDHVAPDDGKGEVVWLTRTLP